MATTPMPIVGTGDVRRKLLACAIDVSGSAGAADYFVAGYKIPSASVETNPDSETMTDILGDTHTTVNKFEPVITFEPHRLFTGDKIGAILLQYFRDGSLEKFSQFKCILIYGFLGTEGAYQADLYNECTILPNSIGGESYVEMPFEVHFGGEKTQGTVDALRGSVNFSAA